MPDQLDMQVAMAVAQIRREVWLIKARNNLVPNTRESLDQYRERLDREQVGSTDLT